MAFGASLLRDRRSRSSRKRDAGAILTEKSVGFPALAQSDARILILGSLPGERSIAEQQYYAHPRNAFWPIMRALLGVQGSYTERVRQLAGNRIALWDVLQSSVRPGSLDASIVVDSASVNDFTGLFRSCPEIGLIAFNGRKAEQLFTKLVDLRSIDRPLHRVALPSTSPAYAAMPFSGKLSLWRQALGPTLRK